MIKIDFLNNYYKTKLVLILYNKDLHCIVLKNHENFYYIIIEEGKIKIEKINNYNDSYDYLFTNFTFFNLCVTNKEIKLTKNKLYSDYFNITNMGNIYYNNLKFQPTNNSHLENILKHIYNRF